MNFKVTDRNGYVLAEKRADRNRAEALATVARIEQRLALEKLCRKSGGPRTGSAAHLLNRRQAEPAAIFQINQIPRGPDALMAIRTLYGRLVRWVRSILKGVRS